MTCDNTFRYWEKPSPLPPGWEVRRDQRGRVYYVGEYYRVDNIDTYTITIYANKCI